jgi:phage pi2 protein 07
MIYELEKAEYPRAKHLFTTLQTHTAIESIFTYKNEARLFVDHPEKPESLFILNSWAYYYLAGETENDQFNASLVEFLDHEFFPECITTQSKYPFKSFRVFLTM